MTIYEYQFGVYVEADNEQDAWEKVREVSERLDSIDIEGDSVTDGPREVDKDEDEILIHDCPNCGGHERTP